MKSSELHRLIQRNGWICIRCVGSHYIYQKDGQSFPVPFHGSKEVGRGLEAKIKKEMRLI
ncbi:YcfA-like protein [compost metagenome]